MDNKILMTIKKNGVVLMEHKLSRLTVQEGNLSLGLKSTQMFDIPMVFQGMYDVTVITPTQTVNKKAIYISYNYMVFSNTMTEEDGSLNTYLDCSDNGLLFKIVE